MTERHRTRPAERSDAASGNADGAGSAPAGAGAGAGGPGGPSDWERVREEARAAGHPGGARGAPDLSPLLALLDALRGAVPRELEQQFTALVREALLTLRALIDWYLERLDGRGSERRVEDIPIE